MDENRSKGSDGVEDDTYVLEDTGESVEEIEREMKEAAKEAVQAIDGDASIEVVAASGTASTENAPENSELRDRYLRTLADFENYRKRIEREKNDFLKYALASLLRDLLPVLDNFDRGLDHAEEGDEFHKGMLLSYKQLFDMLQKNGLRTVDQAGVPFDPNIHEAVVREEDSSVPSHTVVAILQKGYFLNDRLLRPAMVKVAVGGPDAA